MNQAIERAVDAISASPAIRLRYRILAAKAGSAPPLAPLLPPPVEIPSQPLHPFYDGVQRANDDRHPLAHLMRLRDEAAAQVERLLAFLDDTDGFDDREADDSEPTTERSREFGRWWDDSQDTDHEATGDEEPSLGWTTTGYVGADDDREAT